MNRVAYFLNGALYINHLPPQKLLCINPVTLKNPKGIARTGGKNRRAIHQSFLGSHARVTKTYSSSECMRGQAGGSRPLGSGPAPPGAAQLPPALLSQQCRPAAAVLKLPNPALGCLCKGPEGLSPSERLACQGDPFLWGLGEGAPTALPCRLTGSAEGLTCRRPV